MFSERRSIRLPGYDYAQEGIYFVTICTAGRECILGDITHEIMQQNQFGAIATACWNATPDHYRSVLDEYIIMPNHIHGIVGIGARCVGGAGYVCVGGACPAPTARHTIGNIIGSFKSAVTKHINHIRGTPDAIVWQRNYYERVIRDDDELQRIRQYIRDNPKNWSNDEHRT